MNQFDYDEALAYLGPRELLVAFNPHALLSRHNLGPAGSTERVIRERHTPELHAQLKEQLGGNPEEDVDIRILNHNFETIATSSCAPELPSVAPDPIFIVSCNKQNEEL